MQQAVRDPLIAFMAATAQAHAEATRAAQLADQDARCAGTPAAGPLTSNEPPMIDARPSVRVGPQPAASTCNKILGDASFSYSRSLCNIWPKLPPGRAEFPIIATRSEHAVGGQNLSSIIALYFHAPWALTLEAGYDESETSPP
jgi:hypothetical protein